MSGWGDFHGFNLAYVVDLRERFLEDPEAVDPAVRAALEQLTPPVDQTPSDGEAAPIHLVVGATNLVESIRKYGHLCAQLDPLGSSPHGDPSLSPEAHGLTDDDLRRLPACLVGGPLSELAANAWEAIEALRAVYCSTTGYDYAQVFVPEERDWLRRAAEAGTFRPPADPIDGPVLLDRLSQVEAFERFLHRTFPGKTRFSLEGLDMLVPMLDEVIGRAAETGTRSILLGTAHRGRLNILAHILQKPYAQIFAEFRDGLQPHVFREDMSWTGDVKYHAGGRRSLGGDRPIDLVISMPPNPSHLEAIDPVVEGMARAAGTRANVAGAPVFDPTQTLPLLIHGDAAFPGQGVVAETLNLARLSGYTTGGTIHIIANNQIGFTTAPDDAYSTSYASGLARGFKIPIVHVNADDPVACLEAARVAWSYRTKFHLDFVIDLVGYRRHGHNEGDEPTFTQPQMYGRIARHPTVRNAWAGTLERLGMLEQERAAALLRKHFKLCEDTLAALRPGLTIDPLITPAPARVARHVDTAVAVERLRRLNDQLLHRPDGFAEHRKIARARERRRAIFDDLDKPTIDWATAEELAFASILEDGTSIRLTGQDAVRGTFSQRHAVLHDAETGTLYVPLQHLPQARASFDIHNSPLTESAALAFEYGYDVQDPSRMVVWEAQYGDFINGAQVIVDQFITSARATWGQTPSLVLLLPHGYEGQGPQHSSARPERFLQAAADANLRLANCTTAAQYFHLLRTQAGLLKDDPVPLIVLSPKSLLRHPLTASTPRELSEGAWRPVIDDPDTHRRLSDVRRLLLCSGKVHVDLATSRQRAEHPEIALCRLEQLYPFPVDEMQHLFERYAQLETVIWVQEEPENMGAWEFVRHELTCLIQGRAGLGSVTRERSASTAEGYAAWHTANQAKLIERAYASKVETGDT